MTAQRIAGVTALVSGLLLVLAMAASFAAGPGRFGSDGSAAATWRVQGMTGMGQGPMGLGQGPMGIGQGAGLANAPVPAAIPGAPEVRVEAVNFGFAPSQIRLPQGAGVNLTFVNSTGVVHDLTVPALGIHIVASAGETRTVGLRGLPAGRYDAFCTVPGHVDLVMRATVVVD